MKTNTMLWLAGAIGLGVYLHKKNQEAKVAAATIAAATPKIAPLAEPTGSATAAPEVITAAEPTEIYERVPNYGMTVRSWQPSWGSYGNNGRRGGRSTR